jgi:hypothetical protein
MSKQNVLTIILSAMPSYFALFSASIYATIILCVATLVGVFITGVFDDESRDADMRDKLRTAWVIHLLGVCAVVAWHNL